VIGDGLAVGRLFGIEIRVSITWAILLALIALVGAEQASLAAPGLPFVLKWVVGAVVAAGFLVSVLAHELAHAMVARRRGVPTTSIVLAFIGGLAPLAIQARRAGDELAIAVSGPALSLALGTVVLALAAGVGLLDPRLGPIAGAMIVVGGLNILLGLLSLLPGYPLDGGRIVRALAWGRSGDTDRATRFTARIGRMLGWTTIGVGVAIAFMDRTTEGLLVLALGWFLTTGARTLDRRLGLEQLLRGVPVRDAMELDVPWVGPQLTIDTFAHRFEGEDGVRAIAVVEDDRVVGVLGIRRLQRLGRRRFASTRVADVMAVPPQVPVLSPDDELWGALDLVNASGLDGVAVAEDGHLAGMLTRRSLSAVVRDRMAARSSAAG
jgi:Zn-dependent protease/CBS domain-containing protein